MLPGEYVVKTTKLDRSIETGCSYKETSVFVKESAKPEVSVTVTEPFQDIAVVNIDVVEGRGDYLYSLDGSEFQTENEFYDVASGTHTVEVKGVLGYCGVTIEIVEVLKHPKFFTPNSDGYNDTWNITELESHPEAEIHIYDRYGAYITKIKPAEGGWDGSKGGASMPSNDYWFEVDFEQEQESNQGHKDFQSFALPTELRHQLLFESGCKYKFNFRNSQGFFEKNAFVP